MSDQEHADRIQALVDDLNRAIQAAVKDGLRIEVDSRSMQTMSDRYATPLLEIGFNRPIRAGSTRGEPG
jgi:hypothetical protein